MSHDPRLTNERLKSWLNTNQPSRERLCLAVLALNRNYSKIRPRLPEGGPDGGRDIECERLGQECFGAVHFKNDANDSDGQKNEVRKKFIADTDSARDAKDSVKSFVFFCNVDLTPGECNELEDIARSKGFNNVDIYWRERIRMALDSPEGLAVRFQYLQISLSPEEQASFFARYGKDLEDLVRGRLDGIETKLDEIAFEQWKRCHLQKLDLILTLKNRMRGPHFVTEHYRIVFRLTRFGSEEFLLGLRDNWTESKLPDQRSAYRLGTKSFFWAKRGGPIENSWLPPPSFSVSHPDTFSFNISMLWRPRSEILASEFDDLEIELFVTENLVDKIARIEFTIDDFVVYDSSGLPYPLVATSTDICWPDALTNDESAVEWRGNHIGHIFLDLPLRRKRRFIF